MKIFTPLGYGHKYSSQKLFEKLKCLPGRALALVALRTFLLYELLQEHETPLVVKTAIIATLGYLIFPLDVIPDLLPGGFTDDIALMAGLLASVNYMITSELKERAEGRVSSLTGDVESKEGEA